MSHPDPRLERAEALLREAGIEARVVARGESGEIAVLRLPPGEWPPLLDEAGRALSARIRALGFGYVTLDLDVADRPEAP